MLCLISIGILIAAVGNADAAGSSFHSLPKKGEEGKKIFCGVNESPVAQVNADGLIQWKSHGSATLPLRKTEWLDWVWVNEHATGVYVAYEATDHATVGSRGGLCKYTKTGRKRAWCTEIPAFNVVAAIPDSASLYVAGIGMAARLDIQTGRYLWKVDGLHAKDGAFNVFRIPVTDGANVVFDASSGISGSATKRLVVAMNTGEVVAIEVAHSAASLPSEFPRNVQGCKE